MLIMKGPYIQIAVTQVILLVCVLTDVSNHPANLSVGGQQVPVCDGEAQPLSLVSEIHLALVEHLPGWAAPFT